jgi:uncharacterized Zn finger protein (UPF0148 family)
MSDFDKEAEREKLREKYEQDKREREATQRMSDLLLKGATMTNAHCGTCGDPLFQMDGTTFCPSCHGNPDAVEGTDLEARPAADGADEAGTAASDRDEATADPGAEADSADRVGIDAAATDDASAAGHRAEDREPTRSAATDATADRRPQPSSADDDGRTPEADRSTPQPSADDRSSDAGATRRAPAARRSSVDGDLETARDSLVRALEKFAAEAAATDDPRHATDCLEAAREAGETLSTLR